jgi:hypothetical protein
MFQTFILLAGKFINKFFFVFFIINLYSNDSFSYVEIPYAAPVERSAHMMTDNTSQILQFMRAPPPSDTQREASSTPLVTLASSGTTGNPGV